MRNISDMVRNQDPATLPPSATVKQACRYMRDRRVGAVLVTEGDHRLLGILPFIACWQKARARRGRGWLR